MDSRSSFGAGDSAGFSAAGFAAAARFFARSAFADASASFFSAAGAEDPVGSYGEGVRRVQKELLALGVKQVDLKLYPDDRHELLNELDREQVFEDIGGWILQTLDNGQKEWER